MSADESLGRRRTCSRGSRWRGRGSRRRTSREQAIEVLQELAELAKQIEAELQRARQAAEADAADA